MSWRRRWRKAHTELTATHPSETATPPHSHAPSSETAAHAEALVATTSGYLYPESAPVHVVAIPVKDTWELTSVVQHRQ